MKGRNQHTGPKTAGTINLYVDGRKVSQYVYDSPGKRQKYIDYWLSVYEDHSRLSIGIVPDIPEEKKPLVKIPAFAGKGANWNPTLGKRYKIKDAPKQKKSSHYT